MRLAALLLLASTSFAAAETVDCEALKNSTIPYQISWKYSNDDSPNVEVNIVQVYRDKSGDSIVWRKTTFLPGLIEVVKGVIVDGVGYDAVSTNSQTGLRKSKGSYQGLPKAFDRKSDLTYTSKITITSADGSIRESAATISYHFVNESQKAIGPCLFTVIQGETTNVIDGKQRSPHATYYIGELKSTSLFPANDNTEFELSTSFTPLELLK